MERVITAISVQKRNPQRVNIYLDGEYAFGLARIVAAWLAVGQPLNQERILELREADAQEVAYAKALNLLSYRPRSEAEIRRSLGEHGISENHLNLVIARLRNAGLLNDETFARLWVENRCEMRPRGRRLLAYELRQRGLDEQAIEQSLNQVDDEALAYQAAQKHALKLTHLSWPEFKQKMAGFLARRGFSYEVSAAIIAQVWAEYHQEKLEEDEEDTWVT